MAGGAIVLVKDPTASVVPQIHSLRMAAICLAGAVILGFLLTRENTGVHLIAVAQFALLVGPIWYRWFHNELDYFEPIHTISLINFVFFGMGAVWVIEDPARMAYDLHLADYVRPAAVYCLLGHAMMLFGYFGPWHAKQPPVHVPQWPRGATFLVGVAGLGFVGYFAASLVERSFHTASRMATVFSPIANLAPLFLYAWSLGWLIHYSGKATRPQRLALLFVLFPCAAAIAFMTVSDKSLVMTLVGIPIIARWYGIRKIPWSLLVALLLILIFVVFPVYNTFRWTDPHLDTGTRLERSYSELERRGAGGYLEFSLDLFKYRLSMINSVAVVVRDVGRWVPFAQGQTILPPVILSFIPRYVWPDKPLMEGGREFGRLFRVTNIFTKDTFIAATLPGELYWNFHLPGVLLGMGLFGFVARRLYRSYGEGPNIDPARRAVYVLIMVQLAHWGGTIANDSITLFRMLVLMAILHWFGRRMELLGVYEEPATDP